MNRRSHFSYTLLILFLLLRIEPLFAIERSEAAFKTLASQAQFMQLIKPSEQLEYDIASLTSGNELQARPSAIRLSEALQVFWSSLGVPNLVGALEGDEDLLKKALALEPSSNDYLATSNRVRYLMWLSKTHKWQRLESPVWLKEGERSHLIPEISERLILLGDQQEPEISDTVFDAHLTRAVLHFQQRHGLKRDGIIGPETLRWINLLPAMRAKQLASNFIKKASYLASIEAQYILINIPAFELTLYAHGEVELYSRVIVGKPYRQTPRLSSKISNLVINPSWRVPRRLLTRDLLPKVREDGSYITDRNFDVFDNSGGAVSKTPQEWQELASGRFPYRLVQKPGEGNTLGRYKFYFENKYNVYLHDTEDKALFDKANRALSSGCIRVENVEGLANWMASHLVKDKQTWVDMQIERQTTQWFSLNDSLPVHLVYWTAWVDKSGAAQYRNDIYHQNSVVSLALATY
ncbi:murein L,D-transpeptidase [Shewanella sp. UCD-KL12]|uniref:L,D-transpeptidase family protein n=1 Tax=Shewanella sp. UCD-KL12 TaxID=1917163 RepID=UPI0009712A9D|nr:L,D-transpeptidase family protein [Shewanella sp. UCD-KL12]